MPQTAAQLRTKLRSLIWTTREQENLVTQHDWHFLEALAEIQQDVKCERTRQATVRRFCNTHFKCGLTIVPAVRGRITFLYTVQNDDYCDPVLYKQGTFAELQCFASACRTWVEPETPGPTLPLGFVVADATRDSEIGRARCGMFAIHENNIWIAPWIQSTEKVVIEWSGIKSTSAWTDDDPISDEIDFEKAIKLYMQYAHERDFGSPAMAAVFKNHQKTGSYDEALSNLIIRCHDETRVREDEACRRCPTWAQMEDDLPVAAEEVPT